MLSKNQRKTDELSEATVHLVASDGSEALPQPRGLFSISRCYISDALRCERWDFGFALSSTSLTILSGFSLGFRASGRGFKVPKQRTLTPFSSGCGQAPCFRHGHETHDAKAHRHNQSSLTSVEPVFTYGFVALGLRFRRLEGHSTRVLGLASAMMFCRDG